MFCFYTEGFKLAPRPYSPTTPLLSTATTPTPTTKATTPTTVSTSPININLPGQNGGGGGSVTTTTGQPTDEGTTDTADAEKQYVNTVNLRIMDTLGTHPFVLCREIILFWRLFVIECICTLDRPLVRGFSSFEVSFIRGFTTFIAIMI